MPSEPEVAAVPPVAKKERFALTERQSAALDMSKGVLIFLIVLAHNKVLARTFPEAKTFLYDWHVFGFFLLTFVLPFRSGGNAFLATRFVRYGVPFAVFALVGWGANFVMQREWHAPLASVGRLVAALTIGSAEWLDRASGARLFWFLPALLGLVVVRYLARRSGRAEVPILAILGGAGFLFAGLIPYPVASSIPLGLPIALYVIVPGLAFGALVRWAWKTGDSATLYLFVASIALLALTSFVAYLRGTMLVLAEFGFFDVTRPVDLVNHAVLALSATGVVLLGLTQVPRVGWLVWLGQVSLLVYLLHQFVSEPLRLAMGRVVPGFVEAMPALAGGLLLILTLAIVVALVHLILRMERLRRFLVPRDWRDWKGAFVRSGSDRRDTTSA